MICNDFLVVKVNCWSFVFNVMNMWILRNIRILLKKRLKVCTDDLFTTLLFASDDVIPRKHNQLECGPMPNMMVALPNIRVQRRKVWLMPTTRCRAVTLPRRETHWNYLGCPKLTKGYQPLEGRSPPYCKDMWRRYCCLKSFFPIVDTCLSCEDIARRSCAMVPRWRFLATFFESRICSEPWAAHFRPAF